MPLNCCEYNLLLSWSANCLISNAARVTISVKKDNTCSKLVLRLIDWSMLSTSKYAVLLFEYNAYKARDRAYFSSAIERKDYKVMIDGWNSFDQSVIHDARA